MKKGGKFKTFFFLNNPLSFLNCLYSSETAFKRFAWILFLKIQYFGLKIFILQIQGKFEINQFVCNHLGHFHLSF